MADQILWINALVACATGLLLIAAPKSVTKLLGLPRTDQAFYPRLLGINLLGFVAAILLEGNGREGLGIEGTAAIDLVTAAALAVLLLFGGLIMAKRGRWILRGTVAGLLILGALGFLAG